MTEETAEQKLKRHEDALAACMIEITKLREENAKLRSEKSDALSVLREIHSDPDASQAHRIKAAGLALPHEVPRLTSQPPALELQAEPAECLADVVARQRARQDRLQGLLLEPNGNGSGDDSSD